MPLTEAERAELSGMTTEGLMLVIGAMVRRPTWRRDARSVREMLDLLAERPDLSMEGAELILEIQLNHLRPTAIVKRR
jgi:hypothetical protein